MQGLRASGHEVGMVGSCPYLDTTTTYSARDTKCRGTGPMVALRAVRHNKVQADVEAALIDVQGGKQTSDSAQDIGLMWSGHMIYCELGMCAGYVLNVTLAWVLSTGYRIMLRCERIC